MRWRRPSPRCPAGLRRHLRADRRGAAPGARAARDPGGARGRRPPAPGPGGFDCFQSPAAHEICARGRKLAGSAQRRAGGGVLQHGSLRLGPDPLAARAAAGLAQEGATSLAELGFALAAERVRAACIAALRERPRGRAWWRGRSTRSSSRRLGSSPARLRATRSLPSPRESQESPSPADNYMRRGITPITCHA